MKRLWYEEGPSPWTLPRMLREGHSPFRLRELIREGQSPWRRHDLALEGHCPFKLRELIREGQSPWRRHLVLEGQSPFLSMVRRGAWPLERRRATDKSDTGGGALLPLLRLQGPVRRGRHPRAAPEAPARGAQHGGTPPSPAQRPADSTVRRMQAALASKTLARLRRGTTPALIRTGRSARKEGMPPRGGPGKPRQSARG